MWNYEYICIWNLNIFCWCFAEWELEQQASRRILQRAPTAVPANRKLLFILTVSCGSVCFFPFCILFTPFLSYQPFALCFRSHLPTPCTNFHTIQFPIHWFPTDHHILLHFPSCWSQGELLLDYIGGGAAFLWCFQSLGRSPLYGRLFIHPLCYQCSPN